MMIPKRSKYLFDVELDTDLDCWSVSTDMWVGMAYKIPRNHIREACSKIERLKNQGVYILFGDEVLGKRDVYIGESRNVDTRLPEQLNQCWFEFKEAIVFVSSQYLHHKYVEAKLINILKKINKCNIKQREQNLEKLRSTAVSNMNYYIDIAKIAVECLSYRIFIPLDKNEVIDENLLTIDNTPLKLDNKETVIEETKTIKALTINPILYGRVFYYNKRQDCMARGEFLNPLPGKLKDRFKVYKGSIVSLEDIPSFIQSKSSYNKFNELFDLGIISENSEKRIIFNDDYIFNSSTTAIEVVIRSKCAGWVWIDEETNRTALDLVNNLKYNTNEHNGAKVFYYKGVRGCGTGAPTSKGFIIFKGSVAATHYTPGFNTEINKSFRDNLIKEEIIKQNDKGEWVFTIDYIFNSPTAALSALSGAASSGPIDWKDEEGKSLKEYQEKV